LFNNDFLFFSILLFGFFVDGIKDQNENTFYSTMGPKTPSAEDIAASYSFPEVPQSKESKGKLEKAKQKEDLESSSVKLVDYDPSANDDSSNDKNKSKVGLSQRPFWAVPKSKEGDMGVLNEIFPEKK